jgi:hypothetical protein
MVKKCCYCKEIKVENEFYKEKQNSDGLATACKVCSTKRRKIWREKNPEKVAASIFKIYLKANYGLSVKEYEEKFKEQDGRCAICGSYDTGNKRHKRFGVDHDHISGKLRGLLCDRCNVGLGRFLDSKQILQNAIDYLSRWENN